MLASLPVLSALVYFHTFLNGSTVWCFQGRVSQGEQGAVERTACSFVQRELSGLPLHYDAPEVRGQRVDFESVEGKAGWIDT